MTAVSEGRVFDALDAYDLELLRDDGLLSTYRGIHRSAGASIQVVGAVSESVTREAAQFLANEFALRDRLDDAWAFKPALAAWRAGSMVLLYPDNHGETLGQHCAYGLGLSRFLEIAVDMAVALNEFHGADLVHRALTPSSILVLEEGGCRLAGFGCAVAFEAAATGATLRMRNPAYISPEHTGRTGLPIDVRSDLYSIGIILFHLLTGKLPFGASPESASGWVHAHLASEPVLAHRLVPSIPTMVSFVIDKLLAKNPAERYQSALGLAVDLKRCRMAWEADAGIEEFTLAQDERAATLLFSSRLYGRERDSETLFAAYQRVLTEGTFGVSVIRGPLGSGKTSLLSQFLTAPALQDAMVIQARADQYGGGAPYAALSVGLRRLVASVLAQDDASLKEWRRRVKGELCDPELSFALVPELKALLDNAWPVSVSAEPDSSWRVASAMVGLLHAFARPEQPLVLIVDNGQWLDSATLLLLEQLAGMATSLPVMLVVAIRSDGYSFRAQLEHLGTQLSTRASYFHVIELDALTKFQVEEMVQDLFGRTPVGIGRLPSLIHHKTAGIPYFVKQFIKSIVDEGLVSYVSGTWQLSIEQIDARSLADNMVELVLRRLIRLPRDVGLVLGVLASLAQPGSIELLVAMTGVDQRKLRELLEQAREAEVLAFDPAGYSFTHERLQEAAYDGLDEVERMRVHYAYGGYLAMQAELDQRDDTLSRAADHLGKAGIFVTEADALPFAALALAAGRRARRACAYASAAVYLEQAWRLLSKATPARDNPSLAFDVEFELARCRFLTGDLEPCSVLVARLLTRPANRQTRGQVQALAVDLEVRRGHYRGATRIALEALSTFGIDIPEAPTDAACDEAYAALRPWLMDEHGEALRALPEVLDPELKVSFALLASLSIAATFVSPRIQFLQLCHTLQLTLSNGIAPESTVSLAWFGVMACERYRAFSDGFEYAQLARALVVQHGYMSHEAQVWLPLDQLSVWTQPLAFSLECAQAGFDAAKARGDYTVACFEVCHRTCLLLTRGDNLSAVADDIARALSFVVQVGFADIEAILRAQQDFVDYLRSPGIPGGGRSRPLHHVDACADAATEPMSTLRFWRWLYIGILDYLDGDFENAFRSLAEAGRLAWSAPAHIHLLEYHLFSVLVLCSRAGQEDGSTLYEQRIDAHIDQLRAWAASNPLTFSDKLALAEGARHALSGNVAAAMTCYDNAAQHARAHGFDHFAGIAHERAADLSRSQGHATAAGAHAAAACVAYRRWGALGKVAGIEQAFLHALPAQPAGLALVETVAIRDVDTVIRSARALSEEIETEPLVKTLLTIALEHASAQRGLLIRLKDDKLFIEANARLTSQGVAVDIAHILLGEADLPLTMLYAAIRMRVTVSVSDSQRPAPYTRDPYLVSHPRCAAIIIPMMKQAQLVGLLYLENRLSSFGFTGEHTQVLSLLAAQAAISLETARLYADLVKENRERRRIEKALHESRATLLLGERINQTGSWTWEVASGIVTCSAEFCRIFNLDPATARVEFDSLIEHIYPPDRARVEHILDEAVKGQRPLRLEHRIIGRKGVVRHLCVIGQPMLESEPDMYVGTVSDITHRKTDEELQRRLRADLARTARMTTVGELTAAIAHEVNQPLMSISTNAGASLRWLRRDPQNIGQVEGLLQEIAAQSLRAGKIITTLQTLAHRSPQFIEVDVDALIRQLVFVARSDLDRNEIMLQLDLGVMQNHLEGDAVQLQQVLDNLIGNAVDALAQVHGRERVLRIATTGGANCPVEVAVEDNGIGLDESILESMFEPFVSNKPDGMGMGLAICRSIVGAHGGEIRVSRVRPHGCRVVVTLPIQPADPAASPLAEHLS